MGKTLLAAAIFAASLDCPAGWVQHHVLRSPLAGARAVGCAPPAGARASRPVVRRRAEAFEKKPAKLVGLAYSFAWLATIVCWGLCAWVAPVTLAKSHYRVPAVHARFMLAQGLAPLLLVNSVFKSLRGAANAAGWHRLSRMTYRRLNLAVAAASLWLAAAAWFGPLFTGGAEVYASWFVSTVAGTHTAVALLCLLVWRYSVGPATRARPGGYLARVTRGFVGSVWGLVPHGAETSGPSVNGSASHLDDPDTQPGRDGRNEYALACVLFMAFAVLPCIVAFPLATVPTFLGPSLARAASAWTFLAAIVAYVLKDASQRNRVHSGTTFGYLRRGLIASSGLHLLLAALRLWGADGGLSRIDRFYPDVLACPRAAALSLVMHGLVVFAALTPLPQEDKTAASASTSSEQAAAPEPAAASSGSRWRLPSLPKPSMPSLSLPRLSLSMPSLPSLPRPSLPKMPGLPKVPGTPAVVAPSAPRMETPSVPQVPVWVPDVGDEVDWNGKVGTVRFVGAVHFGDGDWVGIELHGGGGMHDGTVLGKKYFDCAPGSGVFAIPAQIKTVANAS